MREFVEAELQIYLLGHMRLFVGERPFPLKTLPKAKSLLAYCLLHPDTAIPRDQLAFTLWPDATEKEAKSRLRRHLYDLRQALPPTTEAAPWLLVTAKTVQWNPAAPYWLDVAAFTHLNRQQRLAEAITIYLGQLLPDLDEPWLTVQRQSLQMQFIAALGHLLNKQWRLGDWRQAAVYAQQALAEDGFNETVLRQLMALHYALGERATAVSQFNYFAQQLAAELDVEPLPETTAVYKAIQQNQNLERVFTLAGFEAQAESQSASAGAEKPPIPYQVPAPLRQLVGRSNEKTQICQLLISKSPARLLTLTGTGGIGKTRLAIAVAQTLYAQSASHFPDGIFFVSLAPLQKPEQVVTAVADALSVPAKTVEGLREHLRYRQCLLILDNFEHLLPAVGHIHNLLQTARQLQLLITSRVPLSLHGEQLYPVAALELPTDDSQYPNYSITQLQNIESITFFTAVARSTNPQFELTTQNSPSVAQICQRLDGLPLAIELAAARSKHFPPDVLLKQLTTNLKLLTSQAQDVPDRHRSLEAALQWSYDLLSEAEKQLLAGLSLFEDGFSVTAVAYTLLNKPFTTITDIDAETTTLLTSLADKSLIYPAANRMEGELRFGMLRIIRSFAAQKLVTAVKHQLLAKLAAYFAQWEPAIIQAEGTDEAANWGRSFQIEYENITAVLEHIRNLEAAPLALIEAAGTIAAYKNHWLATGDLHTVQPIADMVLAHAEQLPVSLCYRLTISAGHQASERGDFEMAKSYILAARSHAEQTNSPDDLIHCLQLLSGVCQNLGEFEEGLLASQEAQDLLENSASDIKNYVQLQARVYGSIGIAYFLLGNYAEAERYMLLQLESGKERGYHFDIGGAYHNLGVVALNSGDLEKASGYLREAITAFHEAHSPYSIIVAASVLASLAQNLQQYERCVLMHSATITWEQRRSIVLTARDEQDRQEELALSRTKLGEHDYQVAWRNGRNLTLDQLYALALEEQSH
ncbi:BTAD domain-containing putative transcriptional regulator [Candidatus Leptofilum sp.]|uniref:BTAD domain-containing putative transcriptional regulator n=1 Tax=Candidatus Leptofilum sp. TaxID=3241576 RepID=UPI003B58B9F2